MTEASRAEAPLWLIVSAFLLGVALRLPLAGPERALEGALVLAGWVTYPAGSLMAQYYGESWTLLHQAGALALLAGLDARTLEVLLCVVPAGLMLAAFALCIHGFCGRPLFAVAAATLCFLTGFLVDRFGSPDYPLLGVTWDRAASHSYGLWAGALAAWCFGALACGRGALAGASAALLVAVHPVIGAYVVAVLVGAVLLGRALFPRIPSSRFAMGLALGGAVSGLSLAAYLWLRPPSNAAVDATALDVYMRVWEFHRNVGMAAPRAILVPVAALAAALVGFLAVSRGRRGAAGLGALALLLALFASTALYFAVHLRPGWLPELVVGALPGRLLNVHAALAGAACVGISASLFAWPRSGRIATALVWLAAAVLAVATDVVAPVRAFATRAAEFAQHRWPHLHAPDPFWSEVRAARLPDLVLTSYGSRYHALVEGHLPVAFDLTGFDFVPYFPHTAREVQRFVEIGYGVSFADPPPELRQRSALEGDPQRAYWEGLTLEAWRALGRELGVASVVAPSDWRLALPARVPGPHFSYYAIPPAP